MPRSCRTGNRAGVAHVDISTGEFRATEIDSVEARCRARNPKRPRSPGPYRLALKLPCLKTDVEPWVFGADYASRSLCDHFHLLALDGCGLEDRPLATGAAAAILHYLRETQRAALDHLERPAFYDRADALVLDATTVRNLELVEPLFAGESKDSTLLNVLDRTRTGMGGRLLRRRLLAPSIDTAEIEARLDAVEELHSDAILRAELAKDLAHDSRPGTPALEISFRHRRPARSAALARSLAVIPSLKQRLAAAKTARLSDISSASTMSLKSATASLPPSPTSLPSTSMTAALSATGFDPRLDELRDISQNSKTYLAQIEQRERTRTGIASLKVRFNNVFGYYIEISKANHASGALPTMSASKR